MEDFIRDEMYFILGNNEDYKNLNNIDMEEVVDNTIDNILLDNELNETITQTILWYMNRYINNSDLYDKVKEKEEV
jgi:hypothetical protein